MKSQSVYYPKVFLKNCLLPKACDECVSLALFPSSVSVSLSLAAFSQTQTAKLFVRRLLRHTEPLCDGEQCSHISVWVCLWSV